MLHGHVRVEKSQAFGRIRAGPGLPGGRPAGAGDDASCGPEGARGPGLPGGCHRRAGHAGHPGAGDGRKRGRCQPHLLPGWPPSEGEGTGPRAEGRHPDPGSPPQHRAGRAAQETTGAPQPAGGRHRHRPDGAVRRHRPHRHHRQHLRGRLLHEGGARHEREDPGPHAHGSQPRVPGRALHAHQAHKAAQMPLDRGGRHRDSRGVRGQRAFHRPRL